MGQSNEITYLYFCTLKGLAHPHTAKRLLQNGRYAYYLI